MTRRASSTRVAIAALFALGACAHAERPSSGMAEVVWPAAPEKPRARLALVAPDRDLPTARRSFWRRAVDALIGFDGPADAPRPLERPFGVAFAPGGEVLIADPDAPAVARVGRDGVLRRVECAGEQWGAPMALAVLLDGAIVVADAGAARIVRVGDDGRCSAFGDQALERPTGLAVSGDRIYVADPPRHAIVVFGVDGAVLATMGTRGEGDGELSFPTAVAVAPDGAVLVVDALNFRIARFAPDGRWLGAFGSPGDAGGAFARPKGVAVGGDGRIYVSDAQRDLVLVFHPDGSFEYSIGESGSSRGRFAHPAGLVVAGGMLYVADSHNARVQGFDIVVGGGS